MAFRSEFAEWSAEIERKAKPKLPAIERAAWLWRPKAAPAVDHFVWVDPFAGCPAITEIEE